MLLMIDNYDSFTYNLVQYFGELGAEVKVLRNDKLSLSDIDILKPERIVVSPGPCTPEKAGLSVDIIKSYAGKLPILGVCLGHQSIAYAFGATIKRADKLMHGKTSLIFHDGETVFKDIANPFEATRYHSLIIDEDSLSSSFKISAWTKEGEIMGIRHKDFFLEGLQFHPESILTKAGKNILKNFLEITT
ncbi:MAG: aminodeoxychorismate/anthranilate synthase component II [Thermodesulfobacteriota bacterium]